MFPRERLQDWVHDAQSYGDNRLDLVIEAADLRAVVEVLRRWGALEAITGLDHGDSLEVLYHVGTGALVLTLRVRLPRENATIDSIAGLMPVARLYEMELREMFGITIQGLPGPDYLFLPEDWTPGVYPLRKDAPLAGS